jgi:glutamyl-tRNA synthetase
MKVRWECIHECRLIVVLGPEVGGKYGPYRQSERSNLYQEHAEKLAKSGHAFRCFCSPETLRDVAEANSKLGLGSEYNGACLSIPIEESSSRAASGEPHVVRLKDWRRSSQKRLQWEDVLRGQVSMSARKRHKDDQMDDAVLLKSDGLPTYHLANVVDDHFMKITHVIRGNEWFTSTWKHICLYEAFGWTPPKFAHVGLLLDSEGKKLSKRDKTFGLEEVRDAILPETMANFLALLGWHHGHDGSEYFTMADLENEVSTIKIAIAV